MAYTIKAADKGRKYQEVEWTYFSPQAYETDIKYTVIEKDGDQQAFPSGSEPSGYDISKYNEWELGKDAISRTWTLGINESKSATRVVYIGEFTYSKKGEFKGGVINSSAAASKGGSADIEYTFTFENPLKVLSTNFYGIGQDELIANQNMGSVEYSITNEAQKYFPQGWEANPFGLDLIKSAGEKEDNNIRDENDPIAKINSPNKFNKKSADKITNFNPSTDTLEIDTDSFGIDRSATFSAGKNKKAVKNKLAKQGIDFLYDQKKGGLYFNKNGADKGFGDGGIIAILKGAPDLTSGNLEFI